MSQSQSPQDPTHPDPTNHPSTGRPQPYPPQYPAQYVQPDPNGPQYAAQYVPPAATTSQMPSPVPAEPAGDGRGSRWSGKKTAVVAALAIGLSATGAIAAAAAVPQGTTQNQFGGRGGTFPGGGNFPGGTGGNGQSNQNGQGQFGPQNGQPGN